MAKISDQMPIDEFGQMIKQNMLTGTSNNFELNAIENFKEQGGVLKGDSPATSISANNGSWQGSFDHAEAAQKILADTENAEMNLEYDVTKPPADVGAWISKQHEKLKDTRLYAQYLYSPEDWAEKGKEIFDVTGIDVNGFGDKAVFEKAWNLTKEYKKRAALYTDKNGHVNMDKVYEAMPYLRNIHEAHGTAAAVMVMQNANELKSINDVYESEAARFLASLGEGAKKAWYQSEIQGKGARAMLRGLFTGEGLTDAEAREIMRLQRKLDSTLEFSYGSLGGVLGGVLGSAAENAPIIVPEMARQAVGQLTKIAPAQFKVLGAVTYGLMSLQMGGSQYIENLLKTDENGKSIYTPREAALLSLIQGLVEGALEKRSIATASKAVFSTATAKKLSDLYTKDIALEAVKNGGKVSDVTRDTVREIVRERVQHGVKAGIVSFHAELEEEFEQSMADMVLENMAQVAIRGEKADVTSMGEILEKSFSDAMEAVPAVAGFSLLGVGGAAYADTKKVFSQREKFANAKASAVMDNFYKNEKTKEVLYGVANNLPEIAELNNKAPELVKEILDERNESIGVKDVDIDLGELKQMGHMDTVNEIAEKANISEEELTACLNGSGRLSIPMSVLQMATEKLSKSAQQNMADHICARGGMTDAENKKEVEFMKKVMDAMKEHTKDEQGEIINSFVESTFEDDETRTLAKDIIGADVENPLEEAKRRRRDNANVIDAYLKETIDSMKAESGMGVSIVQGEDGKGTRVSNNPQWYQNWYADHKKAPTEADYEQLAYEFITGQATRYAPTSYGAVSPEEAELFEQTKQELDELFAERERIKTIKEALGNVKKGDFLAYASLPAEAREVFHIFKNALDESESKEVREASTANAILGSMIAARVAEAYRAHGDNVTAKDVIPMIGNGNSSDSLHQFAGKMSKTADLFNLVNAQKMEQEGASEKDIYKKTGWFKGKDGGWRYEIKDKLNNITLEKATKRGGVKLSEMYDNKELFEAYPQLADVKVKCVKMGSKVYGETLFYDDGSYVIRLNKERLDETLEMKSTLVHEIAHAVQAIENFSNGGSPETIKEYLKHAKVEIEGSKDSLYSRLGGEQEAREVEKRAKNAKMLEDKDKAIAEGDKSKKTKFARDIMARTANRMPMPHKADAIILLGDVVLSKKEATPAQKAEDFIDAFFQSAWHGTPHLFKKFDLGKIGTGEGAQAHGWGLYFAQSREVAEGYKERLGGKASSRLLVDGKEVGWYNSLEGITDKTLVALIKTIRIKGSVMETRESLAKIKNPNEMVKQALKYIDEGRVTEEYDSGSLFEVEIPDNDVLLDEQKRFEEQPQKVKDSLVRLFNNLPRTAFSFAHLNDKAYKELEQKVYKLGRVSLAMGAAKARLKKEPPATVIASLLDDPYVNEMYSPEEVTTLVNTADGLKNESKKLRREYEKARDEKDGFFDEMPLEELLKGLKGRDLYNTISAEVGSDENASVLLNDYDIQGISYVGGRDGRCFVVFNDTAINIINTYNQQINGEEHGSYSPSKNMLSLFKHADKSTFLHEMAHFYMSEMKYLAEIYPEGREARDMETIMEWAAWTKGGAEAFKGTSAAAEFEAYEKAILEAKKNGSAELNGRTFTEAQLLAIWAQEKFARGFETYLQEGNAPTTALKGIFSRFKKWLGKIYKTFTGAGVQPSSDVRMIMERMVASDEAIRMAAVERKAHVLGKLGEEVFEEDTAELREKWEKEAEEEAKDILLKELLEDQKNKDIDKHMAEYEEGERDRLSKDNAFIVEALISELGCSEEEAISGMYPSVDAWKKDLADKGGSFDEALATSCREERERYKQAMPNDHDIHEKAEEALIGCSERLEALEAEILARKERKYNSLPEKITKALVEFEEALEIEDSDNPLSVALKKLKYSYKWNEKQHKELDKLQEKIDRLKEIQKEIKEANKEKVADLKAGFKEEKAELKEKAKEEKDALKEKSNDEKQALKDKFAEERKRLKDELALNINAFKSMLQTNTEWLRGIRDATKGRTKQARAYAESVMANMPVKDATNPKLWIHEARKEAENVVKAIAKSASQKKVSKANVSRETMPAVESGNVITDKKTDNGLAAAQEAYKSKLREAVLVSQARIASRNKKELEKIKNALNRMLKAVRKDKRGEFDASAHFYIQNVLYMAGFTKRKPTPPATLVDFDIFMKSLDINISKENGAILDEEFEVPQWLKTLATATKGEADDYREYRMDEVRDIYALVTNIYTTSRNKHRLYTLDETYEEVIQKMLEDNKENCTVTGHELNNYFTYLIQPVQLLKPLGSTFKEYLYDTLAEATEHKTAMEQIATTVLEGIFDKYATPKERRAIRHEKMYVAPNGEKLTKEQVLAIALNWGNKGNILRAVHSFSPNPEDTAANEKTKAELEKLLKEAMSIRDWEFVQELWDFIGKYGKGVNYVVEKEKGTPMKRVQADSVTMEASDGFITLKGGYYPIVYDYTKGAEYVNEDTVPPLTQSGFRSVYNTGMGTTKERSEEGVEGGKLRLDLDVIFSHVNTQIHITTMRLAFLDAYRIINNKAIKNVVIKTYGEPAYDQLKNWVEDCWSMPKRDSNPFAQILDKGRQRTVTAIMAYRTTTAALNFANPIYMMRHIGVENTIKALWEFYGRGYWERRQWVKEQSPFMRNRAHNLDRDFKRTRTDTFDRGNPVRRLVSQYGNWLIEETDLLFSMPMYFYTYKNVLNAELENGAKDDEAHKKAHRAAEDAVRAVFGSSDTVDQSATQRSRNLFIKALTPFFTFATTQANDLFGKYIEGRYHLYKTKVLDDGTIEREKRTFKQRYWNAMMSFLWTYVIGSLVETAIREAVAYLAGEKQDDRDKYRFLKTWAAQGISSLGGGIPILNVGAEFAAQKIMGRKGSSRNFGVVDSAMTRTWDAFEAASKVITADRRTPKLVIEAGRDVAKGIGGTFYGVPDTLTDAVFNAASAYVNHYTIDEWLRKSIFDKKLTKKGR